MMKKSPIQMQRNNNEYIAPQPQLLLQQQPQQEQKQQQRNPNNPNAPNNSSALKTIETKG